MCLVLVRNLFGCLVLDRVPRPEPTKRAAEFGYETVGMDKALHICTSQHDRSLIAKVTENITGGAVSFCILRETIHAVVEKKQQKWSPSNAAMSYPYTT